MFNFSQKKLGKDTETTATFQTSLKKVSDDFQELFARSFIEVLISKIAVEPGGSSINRRHMPTLYRDTSLYSGLKLNDVPPRTDAIKQGFMFKQGGALKVWRKRHFKVLNEGSNFAIEYYENGKLKGNLDGAGYSVAGFDQEDVENYGPHGLKLIPFQPCRRTWVFRTDDDADCSDWVQLLQQACHKATSSDDSDPIIAEAFHLAFELLRYKYDFTAYYKSYGREIERLSDFICQIVARRKYSLNLQSDEYLEKEALAAATTTWRIAVSTAASQRTKYSAILNTNITTFISQQTEYKIQYKKIMTSSLENFLAELFSETIRPLAETMIEPLSQGFAVAIHSLFVTFMACLVDQEFTQNERKHAALKSMAQQLDYHWDQRSIMYGPASIFFHMLSDSRELEAIFQSVSYPASSISRTCIDIVNHLLYRAIITFLTLSDTHDGSSSALLNGNVVTTIRLLIEDAKITFKLLVVEILQCVIRKPTLQFILKTIENPPSLSATSTSQITNMQSSNNSGLEWRNLLHPNRLVSETIRDHVNTSITCFLDPYIIEGELAIDGVETDLSETTPRENLRLSRSSSGSSPRLSKEGMPNIVSRESINNVLSRDSLANSTSNRKWIE